MRIVLISSFINTLEKIAANIKLSSLVNIKFRECSMRGEMLHSLMASVYSPSIRMVH